MLPTSLAYAWLLWRQHRNGLTIVLGYLGFAATLSAMLPTYCSPGTAEFALAIVTVIALSSTPLFLLGVFTYGFEGTDVVARESCFPLRLFRLPVPTYSLVLWPMIGGAAAAIVLWVVIAKFLLQPWLDLLEHKAPLWWPAFFAAAALAWIQALVWSPFALRGLRIFFLTALIVGLVILAAYSSLSGLPESWLVGTYTALTLVAWAVGYTGARYGRRGDAPNWESLFFLPYWQLARIWPRRHAPFGSAALAQVWFEYRLWGWSLPLCTGMLLIVGLIPLNFGENDVLPTHQTLLYVLAYPVFLSGIFGNLGGGNNPGIKGRFGLGAFSATLPISTADMVAAMLKTAVLSTLSAWAVVVVAVPFAIAVTGHTDEVAGWWRAALNQYPMAQVVTAMIAIAVLLFVATWKRQVDRLYFGLTGQEWVARSIAIFFFPGSIFLCIMAVWLYGRPETHDAILTVLPPLLGLVLLCRLLVTLWALRQVWRRRLVQPNTVARWVLAWLLLAATLFVLLALTIPTESVPLYFLAFGVLFAMPMARLAATPLVLAWNRHR